MKSLFAAFIPLLTLSAATIPMDSQRGIRLFESEGCIQCHRLNGAGGKTASDLGRVLDRAYTPDDLASTMWNHAPTMWKMINEKAFKVGDVDKQAAADLFAAAYSGTLFRNAVRCGARQAAVYHEVMCGMSWIDIIACSVGQTRLPVANPDRPHRSGRRYVEPFARYVEGTLG